MGEEVDKNWILSSEIKPELSNKDLSTLKGNVSQTIPISKINLLILLLLNKISLLLNHNFIQ